MATQRRKPKRQRKKEAAARRASMLAELEKRRRRRAYGIAGITAALILGGTALVLVVARGGKPEPTAAGTPAPTLAPTPAPIACDGKLPPAAGTTKPSFPQPEDQKLDRKKTWLWRLETSCGRIDVKLALDRSPKTVNSVVFLTRKGFFDGLTFHRLVPGFVIQGGDPQGTGGGGPGYKIAEAPDKSTKYPRGLVAMAKTGTDAAGTSGSQFFIVLPGEASNLTPDYAVLGEVVAGMDVADRIVSFAGDDGPKERVYIGTATVVEQ